MRICRNSVAEAGQTFHAVSHYLNELLATLTADGEASEEWVERWETVIRYEAIEALQSLNAAFAPLPEPVAPFATPALSDA